MQPPRSPQSNGRHAVVVIGGDPLHAEVAGRLARGAFVIAADSGYDHAIAAGLVPDVLVGDLDSISAGGLDAARTAGIHIDAHPADKDATDTELALDRALAHAGLGGSVTVAGGGGDRLDHLLASIAVLTQPRFAACAAVCAWIGPALVHVLHAPRTVDLGSLAEGTTISLLPMGDAEGVTTSGLRWPLRGEPLPGGTSRGVSNLAAGGPVTVRATRGVLAVVLPGAADDPPTPAPPRAASPEEQR